MYLYLYIKVAYHYERKYVYKAFIGFEYISHQIRQRKLSKYPLSNLQFLILQYLKGHKMDFTANHNHYLRFLSIDYMTDFQLSNIYSL